MRRVIIFNFTLHITYKRYAILNLVPQYKDHYLYMNYTEINTHMYVLC